MKKVVPGVVESKMRFFSIKPRTIGGREALFEIKPLKSRKLTLNR